MKRFLLKGILNRLPVNSEVLGSPRGFYPSTTEWINACHRNEVFSEISYVSIYSSHTVCRTRLPKTINGEIPLEFQEEFQHELPATFVATIPKGRAWSDCAVISPDDKLLADVSRVYAPTEEHPIFQKWKLRPTTYIDGKVAVLPVLSGDYNYFHWMFEVLPRLDLLKASGINLKDIDYFFTNECRHSFQLETLAVLGVDSEKIIQCTRKSHIKATKLIVPSLTGDTPSMPLWACSFLRNTFLNHGVSSSRGRRRIYINRADASYRKILNEVEIIDFLHKLGFESLTLAKMSVIEQAKLFSSAEIIVAPHGAGLSNIVFCEPETKVIDILMPKHINPCYWFLSNHMSLDYHCIFGEVNEKESIEERFNFQRNFYLDVNQLIKILQIAGV